MGSNFNYYNKIIFIIKIIIAKDFEPLCIKILISQAVFKKQFAFDPRSKV